MDVESLAKELILKNMTPEQQMAVLDSVKASVSQAKEVQKRKIGENVDLVVQALKKIESDIRSRFDDVGNAIDKRVSTIKDGRDGSNGKDGRDGKDGKNGRDGAKGDQGERGQDGINGVDGNDGVSVTNAHIDFDGSLVITLSSGIEINVGEVVAPDLAESIKVITNGGGTSQSVIDTLASLQTQITNLIPSQTGNSGKFLTTNGTSTSWASVAGGLSYQGTWNASTNTPTLTSSVGVNGYYYITDVAGSTNLNGITDWQIGDWLLFNGSVWQKIDQSNLVTSVAGRTGAITLSNTDVSGLGTLSTQNSSSVSITGGSITGITDLAVADGGTGASGASGARTNLGLVIGTDVLAPNGSAASLTSFPTFNQNTTGTASNITASSNSTLTTLSVLSLAGSQVSGNISGNSANVTGTVAIANGGTGQTTATAGFNALAPSQTANSGKYLTTNGTDTSWATISSTGTVTSVAATVPSFLSVTGSPITTSGTLAIAYSGTALPVANGGTGATSAAAALTSLGAYAASNPSGYTSNTGTVTSVSGTGTASGLTLSGTVTTSGNLTLSGTASVAALSTASGSAPSYSARAWVNFNGTGTVAIRASGNVSSITDNNTGDYTVNFTTAMPDADYSTIVAGNGSFGVDRESHPSIYTTISNATETTPTTSAAKVGFCNSAGTAGVDLKYVCVSFFR